MPERLLGVGGISNCWWVRGGGGGYGALCVCVGGCMWLGGDACLWGQQVRFLSWWAACPMV